MTKFGNKITMRDGLRFASRAEADDWTQLRLRELDGQIRDLKRQVLVTVLPSFTDNEGTTHKPITWRADFTYVEDGQRVVWETKGCRTERFRIVEKLFRYQHPEMRLIVHPVWNDRRR